MLKFQIRCFFGRHIGGHSQTILTPVTKLFMVSINPIWQITWLVAA